MNAITAYLGLGSNLGDRVARIAEAVERLRASVGVTALELSSLYETSPVGGPPQGWFLNAAARVATTLAPRELLAACLAIEQAMGRERSVEDGPRSIDLDLLLYGDRVVAEAHLDIPHPAMTSRKFVLVPLAEIASDVVHPVERVSIQTLLERLTAGHEIVRRFRA